MDLSTTTERCQLCTFFVGGLFLGVDVLSVQEVLRARELTVVPLAHTTIRGLLNLRGQIVTAIDLRLRLGFPPRERDDEVMFMIMRDAEGCVALLVDGVGDVIEAGDLALEPPPETIPPHARGLLTGVHQLPGRLLHVLDVRHATDIAPSQS